MGMAPGLAQRARREGCEVTDEQDQPPDSVKLRAEPGVRQTFLDEAGRAWLHDEDGNWRRDPGLDGPVAVPRGG